MTEYRSTSLSSSANVLPSFGVQASILPQVAATTIKKLALDPATCEVLGQKGAVAVLLKLLRSSSADTAARVQAVAAIGVLATAESNRKVITASGGIPILVQLLSSQQCEIQECAAAALWSLGFDADSRLAIAAAGGVQALLQLLGRRSSSVAVQEHAAGAVWNLAFEESIRQKLIFAGAIATLVKLLSSTAPAVQEHAAGALCNLAVDDQNVPLIADTVGARLLVQMLGSGTGSVLELSAQLIQDMSRVPQFREATVAFGVIPALASVLRDRAPDGAVAECAAGALASVTTDAGCARAFAAEPSAASSLVRLLVANSAACHSSGRNNSSSVGSSPGCNALTLEYALIALSHICEYADSSQVISSTPGAIEAVTSLLSSSSCNLQLAAAAVISSIASVQANCHALAASGAIDHLMLLLAGCCCSSSGSGDSTDVTISQKQVVEPASTTGRQPAAAQEQCINTALPVQQQQQQQQCIGIAVPDNGKLLTMKTQVPTLQAATHPHSTAMTPFLETGYSNNAAMRAAAVAAAANATTSGSSHHRTMIAPVSHLAAAVDDNVMSTFASFAEWQPNQSQSPSASGTPGVQNSSSSGSRGTPSGTSGDKKPTSTSGIPSNKPHCAFGTPFGTTDGAKRYEKAKTSRVRQQAVVDSERSSKKGAKGRYVCEVRRESCEQEWLCPMNSVTSLVNASPR